MDRLELVQLEGVDLFLLRSQGARQRDVEPRESAAVQSLRRDSLPTAKAAEFSFSKDVTVVLDFFFFMQQIDWLVNLQATGI